MLALVGYAIDMCYKGMTVEDFANVEIIVFFVVAGQPRSTTESMYSCLLDWLLWKHTTCDMI